ncbi:Gamma-glutamyltranspeptidase precursor [Planctomycetes bacterium MalM25]|nr:Gamma-glutamyltranspeptidase precursor [Planctomycetes bacterium MalM25]
MSVVCVLSAAAPAVQTATGVSWAIATGHPEATEVGAEVLRAGGNAIDAAVAASLALGVAEPYGSGLGGKLVMLHRNGKTGEVTCIEALCASPAATDPAEFASLSSRQRKYGYRSVCVPGLPAGLHAAHERWGSKPWRGLTAPATKLAREGVTVSQAMRELWAPHQKDLAADPEAGRLYLVDGETPAVGDRLANADLAATLDRYGERGADGFYRGVTAARMLDAAQAAGSPLSANDLATYKARVTQPLAVNYRGYRVFSSPPPLTGGVTVLAALKSQESADWAAGQPRDAVYVDRLSRSLQVFYPRISERVADTPDAADFARRLLAPASIEAATRRALQLDPANPAATPALSRAEGSNDDLPNASTSHLVVADSEGNLVSLTQSLSLHFGAAVVAPGTGVLLNDSMSNFATSWKASPNYVAGGKRPRSTVSPVIATRDGLPALALGIPGGQRIPTTTLQLLVDTLGSNVPLDEAFDRDRFHLRRPISSKQPKNHLDVEEGADAAVTATLRAGLKERGWLTTGKPRNGRYFGGGNAIRVRPGGVLFAVADPRRTNHAAAE